MNRLAAATIAATLVARCAYGDASRPATLRALFPNEAEVTVDAPGMARLPLPVEVLTACRADLSDLRLLDAAGNEIAFVVDGGTDPKTEIQVVRSAEATIVDVRREEIAHPDGPTTYREAYQLTLPDSPPEAGPWQILVKTARPRFVRRLSVATVQGDGALASVLDQASLFRLPELPSASRERVAFTLPAFPGSRIAVTVEGEDGSYLDPAFELSARRSLEAAKPLVVPLTITERRAHEGRTTAVLERPPGLVADALKVDTTTPWFRRSVVVRDRIHEGERGVLGTAELIRFREVPGAEALEVPLRGAVGAQLSVEIADGDSPPLDGLAFAAVVRQPSLVFFAGDANGGAAAVLVFGGGRADRPRYDVSRLVASPDRAGGSDVEIATILRDGSRAAVARLGPVRPNAAFDASPALSFAMRPGAAVDRRLYTHRRELDLVPSADGVARLRLGPEELAVARDDLADVRVVDSDGRQWPYLLDDGAPSEERELTVVESAKKDRFSHYRMRLPAAGTRIDQLLLESDAAFIDRSYRVVATRYADGEKREEVLATGRLQRQVRDRSALRIRLARVRADAIDLVIDDGNDAPLRWTSIRCTIPLREILVAAPAGRYALLLGNADDERPRYELEAVRQVVNAVASAPVASGAPAANPEYSARARISLRGGLDVVLFWIVLGAAVVVLGGLTLRLARTTPPPGS